MRAAAILAAAAAVTVSACDGGQPSQPTQTIRVRSAEQEQLHKLNDLNRAIGLRRAIYDSGYSCRRVARSGFVGTYKNLDMWMASCADGREWAVFVGPDGSAQVRDCRDVERMGLPKCEIKAAAPPAEKSEAAEGAAG